MTVQVVPTVAEAKAKADELFVRAIAYWDNEIGGFSWMTYTDYMAGERGNVNPLCLVYDTERGDLGDLACFA